MALPDSDGRVWCEQAELFWLQIKILIFIQGCNDQKSPDAGENIAKILDGSYSVGIYGYSCCRYYCCHSEDWKCECYKKGAKLGSMRQ